MIKIHCVYMEFLKNKDQFFKKNMQEFIKIRSDGNEDYSQDVLCERRINKKKKEKRIFILLYYYPLL